jgi:redox-sensitive bicupin YhaK (pirin superfamily)
MKLRNIANHYNSQKVNMGPLEVKQPIPSAELEQASPFLLLHHFGPFKVEPGINPMDVGGHPHRGFEPVSFIFQGELEHHDSRGNHGLIKPGGVQWMTAGRGIIHSERASKAFIEKGGTLEGIQLWVNLRAQDKMIEPSYQEFSAAEIPLLKGSGYTLGVVAGTLENTTGPVKTHTSVNAAMLEFESNADLNLEIPKGHHAMIYFLEGEGQLNGAPVNAYDFVRFEQEGDGFEFKSSKKGKALVLSGELIDEPVASYGPYVMNNQTELLEAMRDYQSGKMGLLIEE